MKISRGLLELWGVMWHTLLTFLPEGLTHSKGTA